MKIIHNGKMDLRTGSIISGEKMTKSGKGGSNGPYMQVLLDTNVIIDALRKKRRRAEYLESLSLQGLTLCICAVVLTELYTGVLQSDEKNVRGMTQDFVFLPTHPELGRLAGVLRKNYRDRGIALSTPDCLIAATAIHYDVMLATDNQRDFPMPELRFHQLPVIS